METTTIIDTSATLDNGLMARLQQHTPGKYDPAAFRARIAAAIAAARAAPWECGPAPDSDDAGDDELVDPSVPAPRRQRKRSLAMVLVAARKAGANHVTIDGAVIALSPAADVPESTTNPWDAVLEVDHDPH